jgi:hypothetical protein
VLLFTCIIYIQLGHNHGWQATPLPCGIKSIELSLAEVTNVDKSRPNPSRGPFALWALVACRLRLTTGDVPLRNPPPRE